MFGRLVCVVLTGGCLATMTADAWAQGSGPSQVTIGSRFLNAEQSPLEAFGIDFDFSVNVAVGTIFSRDYKPDVNQTSSNGRTDMAYPSNSGTGGFGEVRADFGPLFIGARVLAGGGTEIVHNGELDNNTNGPDSIFRVRREAAASLIVGGSTIIIGGVNDDGRNRNGDRIPFLGDLPFLGALFRNAGANEVESPLQIFLRPRTAPDPSAYAPASPRIDLDDVPGLVAAAPMGQGTGFAPPDKTGRVVLSPWFGVRWEEAKLSLDVTEGGTTYRFRKNDDYTALTFGVDLQAYLTNNVFVRGSWIRDRVPDFGIEGQAINFHTATAGSENIDSFGLAVGMDLN